jgi:hypothetical protein
LAFESLPKLYAHLGAGHLTLIYAVCWTPWLLYVERRIPNRRIFQYLLPGAVLGIIALADIRWTAYSGILWAAYSLRGMVSRARMLESFSQPVLKEAAEWAFSRVTNLIFAGLLSAPLLLPLIEYAALSTRSKLSAADNIILSLPPSQLIGLIYPNIGGSAEWLFYPGAVLFGLSVYAASMPSARKRSSFWLVMIVLTLIISLGVNIPFLNVLFSLPGLNLLRVPPRILFLTGFSFCVVGGYSFQSLYTTIQGREWAAKDPTNLVIFALTTFTSFLAMAVWWVVRQDLTRIQFAWGAIFSVIGTALIMITRKRYISLRVFTVLMMSACLIDLIGVNGLSLIYHPANEVLAQGKLTADYLSAADDLNHYRIYSPSYSLPQQTASLYHFQLVDGVDPLQLTTYVRFMEEATGVPVPGYSVTQPPFASGDPAVDNQHWIPDAQKLGYLNVKYVIAEFPLDGSQLQMLARFGETRVYVNPFVLPRGWMQEGSSLLGKNIRSVDWLALSPNLIQIQAKGPGMLVLSEVVYPGWEASIDGIPTQVVIVGGLFRGVRLSAGEHRVVFKFVPRRLIAGIVLSMVACLLLALVWLGGIKSHG